MAASFCNVTMVGRLTNEPAVKAINNGNGRVASFGFCVNTRRKNKTSGEFEDDPMFIDCEAFNSTNGNFKLADTVEKRLRKGMLCLVRGRLRLDRWQDRDTGANRSRHKIIVDEVVFLEFPDDNGDAGAQGNRRQNGGNRNQQGNQGGGNRQNAGPNNYGDGGSQYDDQGDGDDIIPF